MLLYCTLTQVVSAQANTRLLPPSFLAHTFHNIPEIILPEFKISDAEIADSADVKNGKLPLFSRSVYTDITLESGGKWTTMPNGDRIWQVKITSVGALALVPLFSKLYLPEGATLHVYMPARQEILGAFTHKNTTEPRSFCAGIIHGPSCVVEYFEPAAKAGQGILQINEVGHAYRWISPLHKSADAAETAGACEVNVACSEAANWQDQKRSVARILVVGSGGQGFCSGALVNNVREDCTPYFLSAQHCSEGTTTAQFNQWVFYFNYETASCSGTTGPQNKTVNGCTKMADSNDNGGADGSDFLLLKLNSSPPNSYNVYYAGWNSNGTASPSGVCIHHPDGDIKKISTYSQTITSTSWGGNVQNTHWNVKWAATTNGHGVTEGGSSGSPLFNNQGMIIGTLTGGNSYCNSPNSPDQFGKFAYHWLSNGSTNNLRLKPWLDPDNTGTVSMNGTNSPCGGTIQNDAGIQSVSQPTGSVCNADVTPMLVLRNFGSNTLQSVTINYQIDGNVYQYNWSGNLIAGGSAAIQLPTINLPAGNHSFTAETTLPNGVADNNTANDAGTSNFSIVSAGGVLNLFLQTDSYGSETTWAVADNNSQIVANGGPYGDVTGGETMNLPVCLSAGCYTFTIYDTYGDGMNSGGNATFQLTGQGGSPVYAVLNQKDFGGEESHTFCITANGIEENRLTEVSISPNPSKGIFNMTFGENESIKSISAYNVVGQKIFSAQVTDSHTTVLLPPVAGVYLLQTEMNGKILVHKLVIE